MKKAECYANECETELDKFRVEHYEFALIFNSMNVNTIFQPFSFTHPLIPRIQDQYRELKEEMSFSPALDFQPLNVDEMLDNIGLYTSSEIRRDLQLKMEESRRPWAEMEEKRKADRACIVEEKQKTAEQEILRLQHTVDSLLRNFSSKPYINLFVPRKPR
jgi:hypothetical protein